MRFRTWLFLIFLHNQLKEDIMSALTDIVNKLVTDTAARLAADKAASDAKDATIADLQTQLATAQANEADVTAAIASLTTLDGTVA